MHEGGLEPPSLAAPEPKAPTGAATDPSPVRSHEAAPADGHGSHAPEALAATSPPVQGDPVEAALAVALDRASAAGEWGAVAQLARELEARRTAPVAPVVDLAKARGRRRG